MVMILSVKTSSAHTLLRRVLKKGRYETLDLKATAGADHLQELVLIRRLTDGMISSENYPPSPRAQRHNRRGEIASWENEGGSTGSDVNE